MKTTMERIRVLIADDEPIIRLDLSQMLEGLGYAVVAEADSGEQALELARQFKPDVALLDVKMPPGMDGIEVARLMDEERVAPAVLLTAYSDGELIARAKEAGVYGYLVKPFRPADLAPAIEVALARYQETLDLDKEVKDLKGTLETRKLVERAKGILMDTYQLKEQEAYRRMQQQSMNMRKSMREIAEAILIAHGI